MSSYSEEVESDIDDLDYLRPPKTGFCSFLYNSDDKTVLGRTCCDWVKIIIYYSIYYILLAAFFISMLNVLLQFIIQTDVPYRTGEDSLLNSQPGIGFRPLPLHSATLIKVVASDPQTYVPYQMHVRSLLMPYEQVQAKKSDNLVECPLDGVRTGDVEQVCKYDLATLGDCAPSKDTDFGYASYQPCVYLKMNKIYGWIPDIKDGNFSNNPLVECTGVNPADNENIGDIAYFPGKEIDGRKFGVFNHHFYPFLTQKSYLQPLVAIKMLTVKKHVLVMVRCQLFNLKNKHDSFAKFELLVD